MIVVTSVAGNIFLNKRLAEKYKRMKSSGSCETLHISRMEMDRLRLRRKTDNGTDIGLVFKAGTRLHHGDLLQAGGKIILVQQLPEHVLSIRIKKTSPAKMTGLAALVGHTIGNRHRPIAIDGDSISFPIQAETEAATFGRMLPRGIELKVTEQVFEPTIEVHSHHE